MHKRKRAVIRSPRPIPSVAPLDSDATYAIANLIGAAATLQELPGKSDPFLTSMLLSEVRRILRRGEPEP